MSAPFSILIVEPSPVVTAGLLSVLSAHKAFQCLPPRSSAENLPAILAQEKADLLLLNPQLLSDKACLSTLKIPVIALQYAPFDAQSLSAFDAVLDIRTAQREQIFSLLQSFISSNKNTNSDFASDENYELSDREIEVLKLVAQGLMNKEIADKLCISIHTVISHRKNINRKTGIKSVAGLTVYAIMQGYIASV